MVRLWDAFADVCAGRAVDRTQTRWGKFRPFLLFGSLPLLMLSFLTFHVPAWSPSGEWIAYLDDEEAPGGKHCMLARPDGTEAYVIATAARSYWGSNGFFGVRGAFLNPPVWSPDSSKLLLNVYWDWSTLKTNIYALDLKTHRLALVLKNAGPVWGWAKWDK